jgi:hypothetical protein
LKVQKAWPLSQPAWWKPLVGLNVLSWWTAACSAAQIIEPLVHTSVSVMPGSMWPKPFRVRPRSTLAT